MKRRSFIKSGIYLSSFSYLNKPSLFEKSTPRKLKVSPTGKSLKSYIIKNKSASVAGIESYLSSLKEMGIPRSEVDRPKRNRELPSNKLTKKEIKKYIIGKTLRRPCFDIFFSHNGICKSSWVDTLEDVKEDIALKERKKLGLMNVTQHVLVYNHKAYWYWSGNKMFRDFGTLYDKPLKTEFFFQNNGLLSLKSYNNNMTIWYDLLILNGDYVTNFGVNWNQISNHIDVHANNKREFQANAVPQFQGDRKLRNYI